MGWVVNAAPRPLYSREWPSTHCTGGWVGPRGGLNVCGKSSPPTGIPSPNRPVWRVAIPRWSKEYYYGKVLGKTFIEACRRCVHAARNVDVWTLLFFTKYCLLVAMRQSRRRLSIGICWVWSVWFCLTWHSYFFAWPLRGFVLKLTFVVNIYRLFRCPPLRWPDDNGSSYVRRSWKVRPSQHVSS